MRTTKGQIIGAICILVMILAFAVIRTFAF